MSSKCNEKRNLEKRPIDPGESAKNRDAVLSDFRKVAGPLRGRNRDRKAKA